MTNFRITIEAGACVGEYHVSGNTEFEAKVYAFRFFNLEFPHSVHAQVTKIEYLFK